MSNSNTVVFRGKVNYAKILGDPPLNYNKDGKEWTMDFILTKELVKECKALGIADRVKTKDEYLDGQPFITLKQRELRADGSPNKPIKVVDIKNQKWDDNKLIGNLSDVDVKIRVVDFGPGKKKGVYPASVRVLNLVPYGGAAEFEPIDEDDEFFANVAEVEEVDALDGAEKTPAELDDELPFD